MLPFSFDPPNTEIKENIFVIRQTLIINNAVSMRLQLILPYMLTLV